VAGLCPDRWGSSDSCVWEGGGVRKEGKGREEKREGNEKGLSIKTEFRRGRKRVDKRNGEGKREEKIGRKGKEKGHHTVFG